MDFYTCNCFLLLVLETHRNNVERVSDTAIFINHIDNTAQLFIVYDIFLEILRDKKLRRMSLPNLSSSEQTHFNSISRVGNNYHNLFTIFIPTLENKASTA